MDWPSCADTGLIIVDEVATSLSSRTARTCSSSCFTPLLARIPHPDQQPALQRLGRRALRPSRRRRHDRRIVRHADVIAAKAPATAFADEKSTAYGSSHDTLCRPARSGGCRPAAGGNGGVWWPAWDLGHPSHRLRARKVLGHCHCAGSTCYEVRECARRGHCRNCGSRNRYRCLSTDRAGPVGCDDRGEGQLHRAPQGRDC